MRAARNRQDKQRDHPIRGKAGISAVCLLLLVVAADAGSLLGAKAPDVRLQDQHGRPFELRAQEGNLVVLLAGDRAGSGQSRAWGAAIGRRYGGALTIVGIADLRHVPFFLKGRARSGFAKDKVRVLLDWEGKAFASYSFEPGTANIVLVDRSGIVRLVLSGPVAQARCERLFQHIDRLLKEPRNVQAPAR